MIDLLEDKEFQRLEKIYPFLSRAREEVCGMEKETFSIVDIETTGLDYTKSEIIEIAAIKVQNGDVKDIYNTLIKPAAEITPNIERLTGINNDLVLGSPVISDVAPKFLFFIENTILVAHNSDFDIPFLKHHLQNKFTNQILCTLKASRYLLPNLANHKLHTVAKYFNIDAQNRHRALGDVETTLGMFLKMIPLLQSKGIYKKEDLQKIPG
ncbi:3'-5' exonuclease [Candidatus Saganbacteria bacterium]|nr:3'-5' exonuclease [Candidatus Saganbacteria bacterium]